jgi:hypothetical protein
VFDFFKDIFSSVFTGSDDVGNSGLSSPEPASCGEPTVHDWTDGFGTAAPYQVPAEASYEFPSNDFTTTTFGTYDYGCGSSDFSSWD